MATDAAGAGVGEDVFFVRGAEASFPFHPRIVPTDATIVGIVDSTSTSTVGVDADRPRSSARSSPPRSTPKLDGAKLLLVQPQTPDGEPRGTALLAIDSVGAGVGERVLVVIEGKAAGDALGRKGAPVDAAIIGIIDHVDEAS